jgi:hypothetical protein
MAGRRETAMLFALLISGCAVFQPSPSAKFSSKKSTKVVAKTVTPPPAVEVPTNLLVRAPVIARVHAHGFQFYTCQADTKGRLLWVLVGPQATFEGTDGLVGRHYAGPTWESEIDGSKVVGRVVAQAPSPRPDAIPWLLLAAAGHEGQGIFSNVAFIQRINTAGGMPQSVGYAAVGEELQVPYVADYVFYGPAPTTQPTTRPTTATAPSP